jgi:tetratricopeptide (TPR) repeat protein
VCVFGRTPWWRLLIWLSFALLSLYSARAIPFFAIVAGPITALNWLDFAAGRLGTTPRLTRGWRAWSLGGRLLTVLLILGLLVATVPGWLQAQPFEYHRVGWRVVTDPALEQAALQIKAWRDHGLLPAEPRWFNTRPEVANYLAWFAPGERAYMDHRLTECPEAAADYLSFREALEQQQADELAAEEGDTVSLRKDWRRILRKRGVRFWIYDNTALDRLEVVTLGELFGNPDEWPVCYLQGRIAIFAWKDKPAADVPDPSRGLRLDFARRAFGPGAELAPPDGPEAAPPHDWWEAWWKPVTPPSVDKETAALQELRYTFLAPRYRQDHLRAWQGAVATGAIGTSLPHGPVPGSLLALSWSATYHALFPPGATRPARQNLPREVPALQAEDLYNRSQAAGPTDALYLGLRAARRALRTNPDDAHTHLVLAQAYMRLDAEAQERAMKSLGTLPGEIRRTQVVAALQNCLRLNPSVPDAARTHQMLFLFFRQQGFLDVAANHLREYLNLVRQEGPQPGQSAADHAKALDGISQELAKQDDKIQHALNQYQVDAGSRPPLLKVQTALQRGLAETALQVLDEATPGEVKGPNDLLIIAQLTGLLLDLGRLDKARDLLMPDLEGVRGQPVPPDYLSYHLRLAAAQGDYAEAERHLTDALNHAWKDPQGRPEGTDAVLQVGFSLGRILLAEAQRAAGAPHALGAPRVPWVPNRVQDLFQRPFLGQSPSEFWVRRWRMEVLQANLLIAQQRDQLQLLRAWLALESGHNDKARRDFQVLRESVVPSSRWIPEMDRLDAFLTQQDLQALHQINLHQNVARALAQHYLKWLEE